MISDSRQNIKVLFSCADGRLTAYGSDLIFYSFMVMYCATFAIACVDIWFTTESVAGITRLRVVEQRIVSLIYAHFALSLETIPAVEDAIIRWVIVVWIVV